MMPKVDLGAEVKMRDPLLVTQFLFFSVIILLPSYEIEYLVGYYVTLSFLFVLAKYQVIPLCWLF